MSFTLGAMQANYETSSAYIAPCTHWKQFIDSAERLAPSAMAVQRASRFHLIQQLDR